MNVILDTNIVYDYIGRSNLNMSESSLINRKKLVKLLESPNNTLFITSATLNELIVRFSSEKDILEKLIVFIENNEIEYHYVGLQLLNVKSIMNKFSDKNQDQLNKLFKDALAVKVEYEITSLCIMCDLISTYYIDLLFKTYENELVLFNTNSNSSHWILLKTEIFKELTGYKFQNMLNSWKEIMKNDLKAAYSVNNSNKVSRVAKDWFNELLKLTYYEFTKVIKSSIKEIYPSIGCSFISKVEETFNPNHVNMTHSKIAENLGKKHGEEIIEDIRVRIIESTSKSEIITEHMACYLAMLVEDWLIRGKKFDKNDMLDLLVIKGLEIENSILLSMDKKVRDYLEMAGHESVQWNNNVKGI